MKTTHGTATNTKVRKRGLANIMMLGKMYWQFKELPTRIAKSTARRENWIYGRAEGGLGGCEGMASIFLTQGGSPVASPPYFLELQTSNPRVREYSR